jgi:aminopeptidase N
MVRQPTMGKTIFVLILFALTALPGALPAVEFIHHDLIVSLDPPGQHIAASDTISLLGDAPREIEFTLHGGLSPSSPTPGVVIRKKQKKSESVLHESFRALLPKDNHTFTVQYSGTIHHPLEQVGVTQARGYKNTPGIISDEGVYLSGTSGWYPEVSDRGLITFSLDVSVPQGWSAVSQGKRKGQDVRNDMAVIWWDSPEPQEEIYLIAGRFTEFLKPWEKTVTMVFLREPDSALARKYLDATAQYLAFYSKLIGPYPYAKFALIENFWETGFGMPSFTLLGQMVVRLPFIINTSYPHEILHNWWGNGVFPAYGKGNWSEGLTAYLADHLFKEQQGKGAEYRATTLQKYADYVLEGRDFPLTAFTSRHSAATEAIGYGKSLMFFHMLRLALGDKAFIAGLQHFYRENKFKFASFDDLRASFEKVSGKDLKAEFDQWVQRTGAPEIRLRDAVPRESGEGSVLSVKIEQVQKDEPYRLRIPLAVTMEGQDNAFQTIIEMSRKMAEFELSLPGRPLRIDIDHEFDIFRRLSQDEIPPAITQALGSQKMLILLPSAAGQKLLSEYRQFAQAIVSSGADAVAIKPDTEVKELPTEQSVAVLGWENRFFATAFKALSDYPVTMTTKEVNIGNTRVPRENHSVVLTAKNPANHDAAIMIIATDQAEALPGLGRKLPHYHKYSYLAFKGDEPVNVVKGRWTVPHSPMTMLLPGKDNKTTEVEMGKLSARPLLAELPPVFSKEQMLETIKFLASDVLKGRGIGTPELDRAAEYIAKKFREYGLTPGGDKNGSYYQEWLEATTFANIPFPLQEKEKKSKGLVMKNVIGIIPGKKSDLEQENVVIGAHYDHLGMGSFGALKENKGKIHPGADDNASGVAVLIELARVLKERLNPDRDIVFVAFTGEEAGRLGSRHYVKNESPYPASKAIGMVNLDTVGRLGANKLIVLGANSASEWGHIFRGAGFVTGVEINTVYEDLDASDQKSFHDIGVPAVQLFSGPNLDYHRPSDTIDKIDTDGLVKVASVAKEVVEYLANRECPLSSMLKPSAAPQPEPRTERKVSLGTVPDFAFKGQGVRLSGVVPDSPAESAEMKKGDVIIRINEFPVKKLKDLSDALKTLKAGDKVTVLFLRDGKKSQIAVKVKER